jgi:dimethylhistidine N-methyltransferase
MPLSTKTAATLAPVPPDPRTELIAGLRAPRPRIASKFLYDALGSKLFEAVCELPEYYPTRTEAGIMQRFGADIARACGSGMTLVDLGAGNCAKAASLFPLLRPRQYAAIDISAEFVQDAVEQLRDRFADIEMRAVGLDFSAGLQLPDTVRAEKRLFFYPGSSIGNFDAIEALGFLSRLREHCDADGGLLIGMDLVKDNATLNAAYDDALGVTAAFNLNILRHANTIAGTDFDVRDWRHRAFFDPLRNRVEMHLEAARNLSVRWRGGERYFVSGQSIHTENSHKYTLDTIALMLEQTGWRLTNTWTDPNEWFALVHARPTGAFTREDA